MTVFQQLNQIYRHRVLVEILVRRELKARYRGALLGLMWSFVNPLLLMLIYTLVFSVYMRINMENYAVYLITGLLPWAWFVTALGEGTNSIIASAGIIKRVNLPSEVFPLVFVLSNGVHFVLSLPILVGLLYYFGIGLTWTATILPLLILLQLVFLYAITLITSSLAGQFRDLIHIIPNLVVLLLFLTPLFYSKEFVPEAFRFILVSNPLTYVIGMYHDVFYYQRLPTWPNLVGVAVGSLALLLFALLIFEKRKERFAEHI